MCKWSVPRESRASARTQKENFLMRGHSCALVVESGISSKRFSNCIPKHNEAQVVLTGVYTICANENRKMFCGAHTVSGGFS